MNTNLIRILSALLLGSSKLAAQLSCGDVIQGSINQIGQVNTYTFTAAAGDVVRLTSVSKSADFEPDLDVWGPAPCGNIGSIGFNDGFSTLHLSCAGTYTVLVHDSNYHDTGDYSLGIVFATPKCSAIALSCGQVITNTFTDPAQQHTYTLSAVAGDVVRLTSVSKSGGVGPDIDVFDPVGTYLGTFGYDDGFSILSLPSTGIYTVLVRDRENNDTGSYSLGVVFATPKCPATPLTCGQALLNAFIDPAQQHTYNFAANAGAAIRLTSFGISEGLCPDLDIFDAAGNYAGSFGCNDTGSTLLVPTTGTYTVLARNRGNDTIGNYSLVLEFLGGCVQLRVDSAIVRTQQVASLPLELFAASPVVAVSFTVQVPAGFLSNLTFNGATPFTNATITPGPNSQWFIALQTSPTNAIAGHRSIGSLCFIGVSRHSAIVPISVKDLVLTNVDGSLPSGTALGNRVVVIANESLLEPSLDATGRRMLTVYGKPNTAYEISYATNLGQKSPWTSGWTNNMPASMSYTSQLEGVFATAPTLFFRAKEN